MASSRISHVIYLADKPERHIFGGTETHLWTLLPALRERGDDVELIVLEWYPGAKVDQKLEALRARGVTVHSIRRKPFRSSTGKLIRSIEAMLELRTALRRRRDRIIHLHLDHRFVMTAAMLARARRIVFSFHNDEPQYTRPLTRAWFRLIDRHVAAYVAITEHVRDYCAHHLGISPRKIRKIYYGLPEASPVAYERSALGLPRDAFIVGFVGRLTEQKNLFALCDAIGGVPDILGVIVGLGPLGDDLTRHIERNGISNVRLMGAVESGRAAMRLFDLFCFPSKWEGLGLVLVEAMLEGVPIVASNAGAIPEILGDGRYAPLVDPDDRGALRDELIRARDDRTARLERAADARAYARETFTVERMAADTDALYRDVASHAGAEKR